MSARAVMAKVPPSLALSLLFTSDVNWEFTLRTVRGQIQWSGSGGSAL